MLKVLLVDDEYIVLKGIETMLTKQTKVNLQIRTACDALEALGIVSDFFPDVIIADINMPELDGLSMIEKIKKQGFYGKFIIISGYEKIEFFKRAISCQVSDYLLKPISKDKLIDKLHEIDIQKKQLQETILLKLKMCMLQNTHTGDIRLSNTDISYLLPFRYVALCVISGVRNTQINWIYNTLSPYFEQIYFFRQGKNIIFLFNFSVELNKSKIYHILNMCFSNVSLNVGVSRVQSVSRLTEEINSNMNSTLFYEALIELLLSILPIKPEDLKEIWEHIQYVSSTFMYILKAVMNDNGIEDYMEHLLKKTTSLTMAYTLAFLEIAAYYFVIFGNEIEPEPLKKKYTYHLQRIADFSSFKNVIKEVIKNFWSNDETVEHPHSGYSNKVYQCILYIRQNYFKDLSLEELAEQVNLNPSYLSSIFKKEVGMTFLQYLQDIRLKKACDLLKNSPDLTVESISSHVGFRTPSYFYKVFRAHYGISPNKWRFKKLFQE